MIDFFDLNVRLCSPTIVVKSTFRKLASSIMVDLILAVLDNHGTFSATVHDK